MSPAEEPPDLTCPSSTCTPGNLLLGIVGPDGRLSPVTPPIEVDVAFVETASAEGRRAPEARFRFAGPCVTSACHYWTGSRCGLGDAVADSAPPSSGPLRPCAIRPTCRWWSQRGAAACQVCPLIVHTPGHAVT